MEISILLPGKSMVYKCKNTDYKRHIKITIVDHSPEE